MAIRRTSLSFVRVTPGIVAWMFWWVEGFHTANTHVPYNEKMIPGPLKTTVEESRNYFLKGCISLGVEGNG